jgi:hypothetical protein
LLGWHAFSALEIFEMLVDFLTTFSHVRVLHQAFLLLTNDLDELDRGHQVFEYSGALDDHALDGLANRQSQGIEVEELIGCFKWHQIQQDVLDIEAATDKMVEVPLRGDICPNYFALILGKSLTFWGDNIT